MADDPKREDRKFRRLFQKWSLTEAFRKSRLTKMLLKRRALYRREASAERAAQMHVHRLLGEASLRPNGLSAFLNCLEPLALFGVDSHHPTNAGSFENGPRACERRC